MSNMSYCRFTNTRTDLNDCLDALRRDERMSGMEVQAGRNMFVISWISAGTTASLTPTIENWWSICSAI